MKTLLSVIFIVGLSTLSYAQTVTFDDYKKRADACFNKQDYTCAKENYERALRIRNDDKYCLDRLKRANDALKKAAQSPPKKTTSTEPKREERESESARMAEQKKKEGDDLFRKGDYEGALAKYETCLTLPGFSQTAYAKERILLSRQAASLQKDADNAFQRGNGSEGVAHLKKVLELNKEDVAARLKIADYWRQQGDQYYALRQYSEAKKSYEEALPYADTRTSTSLTGLIKNADREIKAEADKKAEAAKTAKQEPATPPKEIAKVPEKKANEPVKTETPKPETVKKETKSDPELKQSPAPNKRLIPKIATAAVGLGAISYALVLNSQYQKKLENYFSFSEPSEYRLRRAAYEEVKAAQNKNGLYKACFGVAAGAAIAETILLLKKPKDKKSALQIHPSSQSWGLALHYRF
ncbi:MAG: hypothetical protein U0X91_12475 [Spirosomataceae bacterium]